MEEVQGKVGGSTLGLTSLHVDVSLDRILPKWLLESKRQKGRNAVYKYQPIGLGKVYLYNISRHTSVMEGENPNNQKTP